MWIELVLEVLGGGGREVFVRRGTVPAVPDCHRPSGLCSAGNMAQDGCCSGVIEPCDLVSASVKRGESCSVH